MNTEDLYQESIDALAKICQEQRLEIERLKRESDECRRDYYALQAIVIPAFEKMMLARIEIQRRDLRKAETTFTNKPTT